MNLANSCPIEATHPAHPNNQRYAVPATPNRPQTFPQLWQAILDSKSKKDCIKAFRAFGSSHGHFAGCPPEVRQKLDKLAE